MKYKISLIYAGMVMILFSACSKTEKSPEIVTPQPAQTGTLATITTATFTGITTTSAMGGGTISANGGSSITDRGLCWSINPQPTVDQNHTGVISVSGSGAFTSQLSGLSASTKYYVRAFAKNAAGTAYGNEVELTTASIVSATFNFSPLYIVGATVAAADVEVLTDGGDAVTERGIVWGTTQSPLVTNNKIKHGNAGVGKYRLSISGLTPRTTYYARAYAVNAKGVSYSNEVSFKTIAKGNITYTFNKSANPGTEEIAAYARLQVAIDSAVWYLNNYTSATKHVYLNYVDGVPTADANNQGWMRFGTNASYQNLRTMLHEIDHTLGTGTSTWWSEKIVGGKLQASSVTTLLRLIQKDNTAQLSGDTQHWWPYGLNQNSEVTSSWDFVHNCLIIEAMRKDGLTQFSGTYVAP